MKYIILLLLIYFGFRVNLYSGIIVTLIVLSYIFYIKLPAIYAIKGNKAYNSNNFKEASKYYEKAIDTGRASAKTSITYILMLMREGEMDKALNLANNTIANPKTTQAEKYIVKEYRSLIYFKQGDKEEALEDAKEIFESYKNSTGYGLLGYLMLACDEPIEETMEFCKEAYDYNSDDRDIVDNLMLAYYKMGDYKKAEEISEELLEMSPKFVEAHYHSALVKKALGDKKGALEYLENIDDCIRTALTTVSEEEIENLRKELQE